MSTHNSHQFVSFQFKIAFTHHMREVEFPLDCTMGSLIEIVKGKVFDVFDPFLDRNLFNDVDVVESGQYDNINSFHPELAPVLEPSSQTIRERYDGRYNQIAFYIRPIMTSRQ